MKSTEKSIVISASRRTDLVGCYADEFVERLKKYSPEHVHTLVVWTKNPLPLLNNKKLKKVLRTYKQLFIHLTVTGMGGTVFEPQIPSAKTIIDILPELVDYVGTPKRIVWRFDPIVHFKKDQKTYSNFPFFKTLAEQFAKNKIFSVKISWVSPYKKVIRNLKKVGWELQNISLAEQKKQTRELENIAKYYTMSVEYCCVEGFSVSRCIDGFLFNELCSGHELCSTKKAKGQRALCGCTESIDIGWYTDVCGHGCVYCYANPCITAGVSSRDSGTSTA